MINPKMSISRKPRSKRRAGVAAVETALVLPILMLLLLGAIDIGQALDVWNKVDNASRDGARIAARATTSSTSDVTTRVSACLENSFPNVSTSDLASGYTVTIRDGGGSVITDLSTVPSGDPLTVEVELDFETVRWLSGMKVFSTQHVTTITQMRRE